MEKSSFFNSVNGDRKYQASDFADFFNSLITNGVFPNPATNLQVIANGNMTVTVKAGKGWINGYIYYNDSDLVLNIDVADGVLNRIDRIALRMDTAGRAINAVVKKGTFASSPIAQTLQRDADGFELALADIYIGNGITSISQANITDQRLNTSLCGIVNSLIQADTSAIFNQYQDWFNNKTGQYQTDMSAQEVQFQSDFNTWFDTIKNQLSGDVAGNLQNQIDSHLADIMTNKANQTDLDTTNANVATNTANIALKANEIDLLTQQNRVDTLVATSSSSYYEKTTSGVPGALLVVSSVATIGQINLADVTPVATGYTPAVSDYVRLVYGVSAGSAELIDARVGSDGTVFASSGESTRNLGNTEKTINRKSLSDDIFTNKASIMRRIRASAFYNSTKYVTVAINVNLASSTAVNKVTITGKLINKSNIVSCLLFSTVGATTLSENYTALANGAINLNSTFAYSSITATALTVKLRITNSVLTSNISADLEDLNVVVNDGSAGISSIDQGSFIEGTGTSTMETVNYDGVISRKEIYENELEATFTTGGFTTQYGTISADASYAYSNYVKVRGGKTVKFSHVAMTSSIAIWLLDEKRKIFQYYQYGSSGTDLTFELQLPDNCCYIVFTKRNTRTATLEYVSSPEFVLDVSDSMFYYPVKKDDKPIITFVDDDGTNEFYTRLKPIFDTYSVKATSCVITNNVDNNSAYMTLAQLTDLANNGYDIVSHTATHSESIYNPSSNDAVTEEEIYNDLLTARKWIESHGFNAEPLVFPWGSYGTKKRKFILQAIKAGYQFAMDATGQIMSADIIDTYWLERYFAIESRGISAYQSQIDACVAGNGWLIIGSHANNTAEIVTDEFFEQIVSYAKNSGAEILTFKDASAYKRNICSIGYYGDKSNRLYIGRTGKILNN